MVVDQLNGAGTKSALMDSQQIFQVNGICTRFHDFGR